MDRQTQTDHLVEAAKAELRIFGGMARENQLPPNVRISQAVLDALIDLNDADSETVGVGTLVVNDVNATRSVTEGGRSNIIMIEVPGKGTWCFNGANGELIK